MIAGKIPVVKRIDRDQFLAGEKNWEKYLCLGTLYFRVTPSKTVTEPDGVNDAP